MDFEVISNHQLTFNPDETSITFPIDVTDDDYFERDEHFIVILSTRVLRLQLNALSILNLIDTVCQYNMNDLFSFFNDTFGDSEDVSIDLDQVFISQEGSEITLAVANSESDRLILSPPATRVTIMDDDSKEMYCYTDYN